MLTNEKKHEFGVTMESLGASQDSTTQYVEGQIHSVGLPVLPAHQLMGGNIRSN